MGLGLALAVVVALFMGVIGVAGARWFPPAQTQMWKLHHNCK